MAASKAIVQLNARKKGDWWTSPEPDWARSIKGVYICNNCYKLLLTVYPNPIHAVLHQICPGASHDGIFRGGAAIIRVDLLSVLRQYFPDHVIGDCTKKEGERVTGYCTFYFREPLTLLRGDKTTSYSVCQKCGAIGSWTEKPYVLRRELPDQDVFQNRARTAIYLSDAIEGAFPWQDFPDLEPFVVPILDEPLPDDPLVAIGRDPALVERIEGQDGYKLRWAEPL